MNQLLNSTDLRYWSRTLRKTLNKAEHMFPELYISKDYDEDGYELRLRVVLNTTVRGIDDIAMRELIDKFQRDWNTLTDTLELELER